MVKQVPIQVRQRLKKFRERLDLTQAEAAAKVGVSRRTWEGWEYGSYNPNGSVMVLLDILESQANTSK